MVQDNRALQRHILCMGFAFVLFLVASVWRAKTAGFGHAPRAPVILLELAGALGLIAGGRLASVVVFEVLPRESGEPRRTGPRSR